MLHNFHTLHSINPSKKTESGLKPNTHRQQVKLSVHCRNAVAIPRLLGVSLSHSLALNSSAGLLFLCCKAVIPIKTSENIPLQFRLPVGMGEGVGGESPL